MTEATPERDHAAEYANRVRRRRAKRAKRYTTDAEMRGMLGRMLRAYGRRVGTAGPDELRDLLQLQKDLERIVAESVQSLRSSGGYTWQEVGVIAGYPEKSAKQSAQQKWGRR